MWQTSPMLRRICIAVVALAGILAVAATSPASEPSFPVTSPPKTITLVLDATQPSARFVVDVASTVVNANGFTVRAEIEVGDDNVDDDDTDGIAVIDVGLLPPGGELPLDVDTVGDAAMSSVKEGSFGVEINTSEPQLVLAARLREGIDSARITFVLTAATVVLGEAPTADETLGLTVTPTDAGADAPADADGEAP